MTRALVLSGAGPFTDPWHDFPATSARLAALLAGLGLRVRTAEDLPAELAGLAPAPAGPAPAPGPADRGAVDRGAVDRGAVDRGAVDLVVLNAARGPAGAVGDAAARGLAAHLARGGGVLAVHIATCGLLDLPGRQDVPGAAWVDGRTMHPPLGGCRVEVVAGSHALVDGLAGFDVHDERYTHLDLAPGATTVAVHRHEGVAHPLVWLREVGGGRVVADALGHDVRSYDSPGHVALLHRAVSWLTAGPGPG